VKEPCISVSFQEGFDLSSFIPLNLFLPQKRNEPLFKIVLEINFMIRNSIKFSFLSRSCSRAKRVVFSFL
jgi:hypothetical protein